MFKKSVYYSMIIISLLVIHTSAQVPKMINYQGVLTNPKTGEPVSDGTYIIKFSIYTQPSAGTLKWTETQNVATSKGLFNILLGSTTPIDFSIFEGGDQWLGIQVSSDPEMIPRTRITSVAYAYMAQKSGAGGGEVPLGTVIDWWRPDSSWPIPDGFAICDGSTVSDPQSPLNGKPLPDLKDKFIRGMTNVDDIGKTGGSTSHDHSVDINHDHGSVNSSSTGDHYHSINVPSYSYNTNTSWGGEHNHQWAYQENKDWYTWKRTGSLMRVSDWDDGIDGDGGGIYPIMTKTTNDLYLYTKQQPDHRHSYSISHDHGSSNSSTIGVHYHSVNFPALGTLNKSTNNGSNIPSFYGLLKIMRIK